MDKSFAQTDPKVIAYAEKAFAPQDLAGGPLPR